MAATGEGDDVKYWAGLAVTEMEEMMQSRGFTAEMMEAWDPEERSLFANMWEGEKYTYLFKVPQKVRVSKWGDVFESGLNRPEECDQSSLLVVRRTWDFAFT